MSGADADVGLVSGGSSVGQEDHAPRLLAELGHSSDVVQSWQGDEAEVLIALHARKSFDSIRRFHEVRPEAPLVVPRALGVPGRNITKNRLKVS